MTYWLYYIIAIAVVTLAVEVYVKVKTGQWLSYYMIVHASENPKQTYLIIAIVMFVVGALFGHLFL